MKLIELVNVNESEAISPKVTYRVNGDKSHTVRVEYRPDKVYIHSNKKKEALDKIVKDRYGPQRFVD